MKRRKGLIELTHRRIQAAEAVVPVDQLGAGYVYARPRETTMVAVETLDDHWVFAMPCDVRHVYSCMSRLGLIL
jgi:hypothetical protein